MVLSPHKSNYTIFTSLKPKGGFSLKFTIGGDEIKHVNNTKFLGITLDENLQQTEHTNNCKRKLVSGLYALNMAKHLVHLRADLTQIYIY